VPEPSSLPSDSARPAALGGAGRLRLLLPGLLLAVAAAAAAYAAHLLLPAVPAMSFAVVLGILLANLPGLRTVASGAARPGLAFSARTLLRAGIVLLGLKLSLGALAQLGVGGLLLIAGVVAAAFAGTYLLARAFRLDGDQPLLLAAGFSICGVSAIGAVAAARGSRGQDVAVPVALVTLCGSLAIAVLPAVMVAAGMPAELFGVWVGSSVHDVGQVVATAQTAGTAALAAAVVVKLARVLLLAPIVAGVAWHRRSIAPEAARPPLVPLFVAGFAAMVLLRSSGWLPPDALDAAAMLQDWLLAMALFGLGTGIRVRELARGSVASLSVALLAWLLIAALGLGAARLMVG
jgi:uncharacterized integral membrane protein (TIGR00698 family)